MFNKLYLITAPAVALLLTASYWSVRIARADLLAHAESPESTRRAIRLTPLNSEYHILLADLQNGEGLEEAARLNPDNAAIWIRRGLQAELRHDARAEQYLRQAAAVSAQYEPRWTLANYYFRHNQVQDFWYWTGKALAISYGDNRPIFNLCWTVTQNSDQITRILPDQPAVWRNYLSYLLNQKRLDAVPPIAAHIVTSTQSNSARKEVVPLLLEAADNLLTAGQGRQAREIWNQLCARKLLPHEPLFPELDHSLTNGGFRAAFAPGGFDWRAPRTAGLETFRSQSMFRASFSGKQPENCDILWQYLPLEQGRKYEIQFEYQTEDIKPDSGLRWRVLDTAGADLSSPSWKQARLDFTATQPLARLVLTYKRAPGTTRLEGSVAIRAVTMGFRP